MNVSIRHYQTAHPDLTGSSECARQQAVTTLCDDLTSRSNFPNPSKSERRLYAVYWQDKLHVNKEVEFPDALLDEFAAETDKFSFAYMKEAL